VDSWRNPPPRTRAEARTGSTRRSNRSHGWRLEPTSPEEYRSGNGAKRPNRGSPRPFIPHESHGPKKLPEDQPEGRVHPTKIPQTPANRVRRSSQPKTGAGSKSPGRHPNMGDRGRLWKTVQTGEIGLITRRSKVQILPPPPRAVLASSADPSSKTVPLTASVCLDASRQRPGSSLEPDIGATTSSASSGSGPGCDDVAGRGNGLLGPPVRLRGQRPTGFSAAVPTVACSRYG